MIYSEDKRTSGASSLYDKKSPVDTPLLLRTYVGIVRETRDPQKMGRIQVWIPEVSAGADNPDGWIPCQYCSPFAGASFMNTDVYHDEKGNDIIDELYNKSDARFKHRTPEIDKKKYSGRKSYGMWFTPPDVGNKVLVTFVNGDINFGVYFGCLYPEQINHMLPGIAEGQIFDGNISSKNDERGPVMEADFTKETSPKNNDVPRKLKYGELYDGLKYQQGLHEDAVRGQSTSSAQRESPSEVFGILTPDGNQFVMDDKQDHEFIRHRTKSGAQLLIHQSTGIIYAISRDGTSWMELSNDGDFDVYGANSVSVHAEKIDVNLKAGNDINMQAGRNINLRAGENFNIEVGRDFNLNTTGNNTLQSLGKTSVGAGGEFAITSGGAMGITSGGDMKIFGSKIILNTTLGPQADAAGLPATYVPSGPSKSSGDKEPWVSGQPYSPGDNIISRVPQHEPWIEHTLSTTGTNNNVVEGPLNPRIPLGATSEDATKPNDITQPDGKRFEGKSITATGQPEYIQVANVPQCALQPVTFRQISSNGLDHIKQSEGVRNRTYKDVAGLDTIGVGHLITTEEKASGVFSGGEIDDATVNELLLGDLDRIQKGVRGCVAQPLTQEQYDACVSLAFNIGTGGFCGSTLVKKINEGDYQSVPNQMMRWNKVRVGGILKENAGLTNRRRAEANLFAKAPEPCED